ncbi:MAG: DEAD/DEAH box helicase [Calditrichota bacterium]
MTLEQLIDYLRSDPEISANIVHWQEIPAREPVYAEFPARLNPKIQAALKEKGISKLYSHQLETYDAIDEGKNVILVTPTASGKTLAYNLPVLNSIMEDPESRAIYLFPTKALSQDQLKELHDIITLMEMDIRTYTFDGDTPVTARKAIRRSGHIVITNPDMLHQGILPHHTIWVKLFENLRYVVIDEIHYYRGVLGSHLANLIRRLKRIAAFYNSQPRFICCSATIANPAELAEKIIEEPVHLIDKNGAPSGKKHFILYNPPVINKELGIRRSVINEVRKLATHFLESQVILAGYPGSIASAWQQAGRAGRRTSTSVTILVASSSPMNQYLMEHPEYFFGKSPENSVIDANNLLILMSHMKCAAFEIPFTQDEFFGMESSREILEYLKDKNVLRYTDGKYYWMSEIYPAEKVSLRSASPDNVVIVDKTKGDRVIGEVDLFSAQMLVHKEAVYMHETNQFHVDNLDWERKKAYVRQVSVDYFTDAITKTNIKVLEVDENRDFTLSSLYYGEVNVSTVTTGYKKIKLFSHENVGAGEVNLPEIEMATNSCWIEFSPAMIEKCGITQSQLGGALQAVANVIRNISPVYIMCDPADIRAVPMVRAPFSQKPTIYLYDNFPGGVGLSWKFMNYPYPMIEGSLGLVKKCSCDIGCPSCVGPVLEVGESGKSYAVKLLEFLNDDLKKR